MLLKDKIAVVTGTSNGIGKSIVDVFIKNCIKAIGLDIIEVES